MAEDLSPAIREAIRHFWRTRTDQSSRQTISQARDRGSRAAVTGGKQMDGFVRLVRDLLIASKVPESCIAVDKRIELPGWFRAEKKWDLVIVPFLGYLMLLEDCDRSRAPVKTVAPHFPVFPEFQGASYRDRYSILIEKLLRDRLYDGACFLLSSTKSAKTGTYIEPKFVTPLLGHVSAIWK
jgi:hypothetical protein